MITNGREYTSTEWLRMMLEIETEANSEFKDVSLPPLPLNSAPEANAGGEEGKVGDRNGRPAAVDGQALVAAG